MHDALVLVQLDDLVHTKATTVPSTPTTPTPTVAFSLQDVLLAVDERHLSTLGSAAGFTTPTDVAAAGIL